MSNGGASQRGKRAPEAKSLTAALLKTQKRKMGPFAWFRSRFATGMAVVAPFAVTAWIIWLFVRFVDNAIEPLLPAAARPYAAALPGLGLLIAIVALTIFGALVANFFGRFLIAAGDRLIGQVPLVRTIYGGAKQVFESVANPSGMSFKQAVLVPFPNAGQWAIGFITNEETGDVSIQAGDDLVAVYMPQAPVPTSGFLLFVRRADLRMLSIPPEDALRLVITAGAGHRDPEGDEDASSGAKR